MKFKLFSYYLSFQSKILFLGLMLFLLACKQNVKNQYIEISQNINMDNRFLNFETTRTEGDTPQGKFYSSADSSKGFTVGYNYIVPDSLKGKNLKIYISAWVREKELPQQGDLIVALTTSKGTIAWIPVGKFNTKMVPNQWVKINDSLEFKANEIVDPKLEIGVVGTKTKGSDTFDLDDLNVKLKFYN